MGQINQTEFVSVIDQLLCGIKYIVLIFYFKELFDFENH